MGKTLTGEYLVVGKKDSAADAYLRLELLGADGKLLRCMYRISTKKGGNYPDLFDYIAATLEPAKEGSTYFIREFQKLHTFENIPKNYETFLRANQWLLILQKNVQWMEQASYLFELSCKSLDAWNEGKEAHTIFLKTLFVFAEKEGYGVKQAWLSQLPEASKTTAHTLIFENAPLHESCESDYIKTAKQLAEGLAIWIQTNTDIQMS